MLNFISEMGSINEAGLIPWILHSFPLGLPLFMGFMAGRMLVVSFTLHNSIGVLSVGWCSTLLPHFFAYAALQYCTVFRVTILEYLNFVFNI